MLFSGPVIAGWKAAGAAERSAYFAKMTARGEVVQQVATAYLRAIADASEVDNAKAQVAQAQVLMTRHMPRMRPARRRIWTSCARGCSCRRSSRR